MTRLTRLTLLLLLLLHLIGIVLAVILLPTHHVLALLTRLAGHAAHLLLHRHPVRSLRQLRTHAHLIGTPASHRIAHSVYKMAWKSSLIRRCFNRKIRIELTWYQDGRTVRRLGIAGLGAYGHGTRIEDAQLANVDEGVVAGGRVNVGDLLTIGVHSIAGYRPRRGGPVNRLPCHQNGTILRTGL